MSESPNRRDFLTTGAVAAGTLALSSRLFAQGSQSITGAGSGCSWRFHDSTKDPSRNNLDLSSGW